MFKMVMLFFLWAALIQILLADVVLPWMFPNLVFWVALTMMAALNEIREAIDDGRSN